MQRHELVFIFKVDYVLAELDTYAKASDNEAGIEVLRSHVSLRSDTHKLPREVASMLCGTPTAPSQLKLLSA